MARYWQLLVKAQGDTKSAEYAMRRLQRQTKKLGRDMTSMGKTMTAGITAPIVALTALGVQEMRETMDVTKNTDAVFKSMGDTMKVTKDQLVALVSELETYSAIEDDIVQNAANVALSFKALAGNPKLFEQTMRAAVDMAGALDIDVNRAVIQLGKAMQNGAKGAGALSKNGTLAKDDIAKLNKMAAEGVSIFKQQQFILDAVNKQYAGQGRNVDPIARANIAIKNLAESLAVLLLPALERASVALEKLAKRVEGLSSDQQKLLGVTVLVAAAFGPVLIVAGSLVTAFSALLPVFKALRIALILQKAAWLGARVAVLAFRGAVVLATVATKALNLAFKLSPVGRVVAVIALLAAGLTLAWKKSERFRQFVVNAFEKVKTAAQALPIIMRSVGSAIIDGIKQGAKRKAKELLLYVANLGLDMVHRIKSKLGIKSPSRVFARQVGAPIVEGIIVGIRSNIEKASKAMDALADRMTSSIMRRLRKSDLRQAFLEYRLAEAQFVGQETVGLLRRQLQVVLQRVRIIKDFLRKNARKLRVEARIDLLGQLSQLFQTAGDIRTQIDERVAERPQVQQPVMTPPTPPSVAAKPLAAVSGGTVSNTYNVTVNAKQPVDTVAFMRSLRVAARMGTV